MTFVVVARDVGCDCCSYLPRASFDTRGEAEMWVDGRVDRFNYEVWDDDNE